MIIYIDDHVRKDEDEREWVPIRFHDKDKCRNTIFLPRITIDHFGLALGQSYVISKSKHGYI